MPNQMNLTDLSKPALILVLSVAQEHKVTPEEAMKSLFNDFAELTNQQEAA